jgi:hypothetical protein
VGPLWDTALPRSLGALATISDSESESPGPAGPPPRPRPARPGPKCALGGRAPALPLHASIGRKHGHGVHNGHCTGYPMA